MPAHESTVVNQNRESTKGTEKPVIDYFAVVESELWVLLIAVLLTDVILTYLGLQMGLQEGNPAMRLAIEQAGILALLLTKLLVVGFGMGVRTQLGKRGSVVPVGLALPWFAAAVINISLLL